MSVRHQPPKDVSNIKILSLTSKNYHQDKVTNIHLSHRLFSIKRRPLSSEIGHARPYIDPTSATFEYAHSDIHFKPIQRRNWMTTSRDSLQVIRQPIGPDGSKGFSKQFRMKRSTE